MRMTMCSTSAMVPVRWFARISSARLMLAGKVAVRALVLSSFRKVRRFVLIEKNPVPGRAQESELLLQRRFDGGNYLRRIRSDIRLKTSYRLTIAVEEKLGEVPLDVAADLRIDR